MSSNIRVFIPLIAFFALAVFFVWSLEWRKVESSQVVNRTLVGQPFPQFTLNSIDQQQQYSTANLPEGAYLINVWASWCPSCYVEHDFLNKLAESGITIVGINYKDDAKAAQKYLDDLGNPYTLILADRRGSLAIDLGVTGAPETYLVDARGIIQYKHQGVIDERLWLNQLAELYQQSSSAL